MPTRIVPELSQLTADEYDDLWRSVRTVQGMLQQTYSPGGFNVAVQDGTAAGQSVPHVHVHVLPRMVGDFERNDDVYDELENWAPRDERREGKERLDVPDDGDRRERTLEEMSEEAESYRRWFNEKGSNGLT